MIQLVKMWLGFDNKSKQFYKMKQNTMMIWEPLCKRGLTAQIAIAQHAIG
jgi:predicted metal-dependent phosphotriesterase family hydrolase